MGSAQPLTGCTVYSKHEQATARMVARLRRCDLVTVAMDYTLAALKVFGSQLAGSTEAPSSEGSSAAQMLFGIHYQRVWIQGVILSAEYQEGGDGNLALDDGSCVADLFILPKEAESRFWRAGMYVMVIGAYVAAESKDNYPAIKVQDSRSVFTAGPRSNVVHGSSRGIQVVLPAVPVSC